MYITITGQKHYFGMLPFSVGEILYLRHDQDNLYDQNAIAVHCRLYDKIGYVAQNPETMVEGTVSANTLLNKGVVPDTCIVRFIAGDFIIAETL